MVENRHQSREYRSIDIAQENNLEEVLEPGIDCCIYRVPQYLCKIKEEAYIPRLISIGPLHYGRKEFKGMENQKKKIWSKFWERVNNTQKLDEFKIYIKNQEQHIRDHYSVSSSLQSSEYIEMIQLDAVFIIELFMRKSKRTKDFLLEPPLGISIKTDLLLLENQVPYFVLDHLYSKTFLRRQGHPSFFALSVFYFYGIMNFNWLLLVTGPQPQVKHFTDLLRCAFVMEFQLAESNKGMIIDLPTATKLNESGLNFSGINNTCFLNITLVKRKRGK
ncbi:hypothetical protein Dsin_032541 [Dipteronia sinensis]|uniref:Uncharacterized protein n=1 Tax=Dipteronia sinensis TaxID=43782 RepID=A0AAD9ZA78_9ROSI|nr:hypothetical protein Dsin_032541 [Dipteronia sinensis]